MLSANGQYTAVDSPDLIDKAKLDEYEFNHFALNISGSQKVGRPKPVTGPGHIRWARNRKRQQETQKAARVFEANSREQQRYPHDKGARC